MALVTLSHGLHLAFLTSTFALCYSLQIKHGKDVGGGSQCQEICGRQYGNRKEEENTEISFRLQQQTKVSYRSMGTTGDRPVTGTDRIEPVPVNHFTG
jgi:hypothetical protein